LPKLRPDLIICPQAAAAGEQGAVVKDPVGGEYYRFGEVEVFILRQLDGTRSLHALARAAEERFGAPLPEETLELFIAKLSKAGLLAGGEAGSSGRPRRPGRVRGSMLYLRLPLFDPTRLFDRLLPRVRACFTRRFLVGSALVILLAAATLASSWHEFTRDLPRLYQLSSIPLFMAVVFLLVMAHEFAHGLACRHFGGEVHEIGLMLLYFQPACYCNVSDAWLFSERSKRLWVGFAGPYFELFLWALAVLAWRLTAGDTWMNHLALIAVTGSGVKTLLNFNPLIKLDGYYLLSDSLDIPNLRKKSFRYVGDRLKRLSGLSDPPPDHTTARERRVYVIYGVLATLYSFSLLSVLTFELSSFLIDQGQPLALTLVAGLVGTRFRHRVRGLLGHRTEEDDPPVVLTDPASRPSPKVRPADGRGSRRSRRIRRARWAWAAGAGALLLLLVFVRVQLRVAGPVNVLPRENADVRAGVEGIVVEVLVDEGDEVAAGEPVARLSGEALITDLRTTEAEARETRALLQKLEAGPTAAEIAVGRAAVAGAADRAAHARSRLARMTDLLRRQAVSQGEYDDARALATTAENDLTEATRRLEVLTAGTRPEEIEAARARLDRLDARRRHLEEQVRRLDVVSPVDGVVATPSRQLHAMQRQLVSKGGLIAKVYDFRRMTAQVMIPEKEIGDVRVGQRVELRTRAYPSVTFHGNVTAVAVAADGSQVGDVAPASPPQPAGGGRRFIVTTEIDNRSLLLRPGMTGQAKVFCGPRRIVDLITRRLARTLKVEVWSWW
jgi:multidrug resistance efflux pump